MLKSLAVLFGAGLTVAACYGTGVFLLDRLAVKLRRGERFPLAVERLDAFLKTESRAASSATR